jgi:nitronate monooxygenase
MWPDRRLCDLLGIKHPIIQAPMAGTATAELAIAVCNSGGLGSLGCGAMGLDEVRAMSARMRSGTSQPFNLNFFIYDPPKSDASTLVRTKERMLPWYKALGLGEPPSTLPDPGPGFDAAKLALVLELRPPVVNFHFGVPDAHMIEALKKAGIILIISASTVAEARTLAASGFDAIIAQGWEAGGHRGSHKPTAPMDGVGTQDHQGSQGRDAR